MTMHTGFSVRRLHIAVAGACAALTVVSLLLVPAAATAGTVTKFASVLAENHAHHKAYLFFADRVKELTGGEMVDFCVEAVGKRYRIEARPSA